MEKNYLCDLGVEQLANFTGRSLSTFKREFHEMFGTTPHKWIMERRLNATAFKRQFGVNPIQVAQANGVLRVDE